MTKRVLWTVHASAQAPWIDPLMNFLGAMEPGHAVAVRAVRRAVIYGLLRSIRKTYLSRLHKALAMSVVTTSKTQRRGEQFSASRRLETLRKAYEALDDAVASGNQARIQKASRRVNAVDRAIAQRGLENAAPLTKAGLRRMSLAALTSALMRDRSLQIIDALTNPQYVTGAMMSGQDMQISAGRLSTLEDIKTPSATDRLLQRPTETQYDILWRHLEFGTGLYASNAKVMGQDTSVGGGSYKNSDGTWWYGPPNRGGDRKTGLLVKGSSPMHVLWGPSGLMNEMHTIMAQHELNRAIEDLAPRFT